MNALQSSYKIYNFTYLWLDYLIKKTKKTHKTAHFEVICQSMLLGPTQQQEWVYELSELCFTRNLENAFCSLIAENLLHYNSFWSK